MLPFQATYCRWRSIPEVIHECAERAARDRTAVSSLGKAAIALWKRDCVDASLNS
jgi:hypothetical protein